MRFAFAVGNAIAVEALNEFFYAIAIEADVVYAA